MSDMNNQNILDNFRPRSMDNQPIFNMKNYILVALLLMSNLAFGQYNETLRTARPGQSFGPFSVGSDVFQVQSGFNIGSAKQEGSINDFDGFNYLLSLRYGITETIEIRSAFQFNSDKITTNFGENTMSGLSVWNVGIRTNILNNAGTKKPNLAFQADARINAVSSDFKANDVAPRFLLLHGQPINDWLSLTTNWGLSWNGNTTSPRGFYTVAFSFPLVGKWGGFIENFGEIVRGDFDTRFDTGVSYLANNNLAWDVSIGYGKNDLVTDFFIDFGVSWRVLPDKYRSN